MSAGRVAKSFLALGAGEAVARLVAFGATVYAARILGPGAYGVLGVAAAIVLYLNRVADFGFDLGIGVREVAADPGFVREAASAAIAFRTLLSVGLVGLIALGARFVLPVTDASVLAVQVVTLLAVGASTRWIHVAEHRAPLVGVAQAVGQALMLGLVIALVKGTGDLLVVPGAQIAGDLAAALILFAALRRSGIRWSFRAGWPRVRSILPRASHLVASALLGIIIYNADFLFLRVLRDSAAVGLYAAAYTLVTFFLNVGAAYNLSLLPSLTQLRADLPGRRGLYHAALAQVFALGLPLALGGALVARPLVGLVFGSGFDGSALPFAILVWCIPLNLLRDVPLMAVLSEEGERQVFRVTVWAAVLNLILNVLLIPRFGLVGAASATVVTETIRMLLAIREAKRIGFELPALARFGRAVVAGALMAAVLVLLGDRSVWVTIPAGVVAYTLGLVATGALRWRPGQSVELTV